MNIKDLKKENVGYVNTPLELMPKLTERLGEGNLYIKRDDLTGLALGGNKTRKLDYLVAYAKQNGYTTLMTFGGVQTNHGRLTVAAAVKHGLKSILVLKGKKPEYMSGNLVLDRLMGTEIFFVDTSKFDCLPEAERKEKSDEYLAQCTEKIVAEKENLGEKVLNIPIGGQGVIGSAGYVEAIPEIMKQMKEQNINAKYLVSAYGSTGTFAGLWAGAKYYNAPFKVIGVAIEPDHRTKQATADFINELSEFYDMGFTCTPDEIDLEEGPADHPYFGDGYNIPDEGTWEYIKLLAENEAVFLDPCYTGKAFHGFVDMVKTGVIPHGENTIFLNTGGSPALWTKEHLDFAQHILWDENDSEGIKVFKA